MESLYTTTSTTTTTASTTTNATMNQTPDPNTAKRGRSIEPVTPMTKQRRSSPEQRYGTPAWRDDVLTQGVNVLSQGVNVLTPGAGALPSGDPNEKLDWNKSMEEEEHLQEALAATRLENKDEDHEDIDDIEDATINLMIDKTINKIKLNEAKLANNNSPSESRTDLPSFPGVMQLDAAYEEQIPKDQFANLIRATINKAIQEAIKPLINEIQEIKKLVKEGGLKVS